MSETRKVYTAEELSDVAGVLEAGNGEGLSDDWIARALRQAAARARVIEKLRERVALGYVDTAPEDDYAEGANNARGDVLAHLEVFLDEEGLL